jgi:hypothetical protein
MTPVPAPKLAGFNLSTPGRFSGVHRGSGGRLNVHFSYIAQIDPGIVLEVLRRLRLAD